MVYVVLSVAVSTLQQHSVMPTAETAWPTDLNICYSPLQKAFSEPSYTIYTHTHPEICMHILLASYSSSHLLPCLTTLAPGPSGTFRAYPHLRGFYSQLQLLRASFTHLPAFQISVQMQRVWFKIFPKLPQMKGHPPASVSFPLTLLLCLLLTPFPHRQCVVACIFSDPLLEWKQRLYLIHCFTVCDL